MTAGASNVVKSFDRGVKFITADAGDDRDSSVNLVYDSNARSRFYQATGAPKRT